MNQLSIIILALAFVIVFASIFIKSFQELVFQNTQGEAQLGKFTVKGVTFLVIVLALVGSAVFLEANKPPKKYTMNDAIEFLKKKSTDSFKIEFDENSQMHVYLNKQKVATENPEKKIVFKKGATSKAYDLLIDKATMGNFHLSIDQESLKKNEPTYYQNEPYRFNNKDFWFKLESKHEQDDNVSGSRIVYYTFRFGEGEKKNEINWSAEKITIKKSDNGRLANGINFLTDNSWKRSYIVSIGAGLFGGTEEQIHIERINCEMAIVDID